MSKTRLLLVLCSLLVPPLAAQNGSAPTGKTSGKTSRQAAKKPSEVKPKQSKRTTKQQKPYDARKAEIRNRIMEYRARLKSGELLRANVKVRVRLRNGESMTGVVRGGNFVEKPAGLEFVRAEMTTQGAGLRLWYYDATNGYIFLPYRIIKTYKVLKQLSDIEVAEILDRIREREPLAKKRGAERHQRLLAKQQELRDASKATKKLEGLAQQLEQDRKAKAKEQELVALIKQFPPAEGWGEKKLHEMNMRRITMKVYPNAKERRFIEVFEDWKKGFAIWKRLEGSKATPTGGAKTPPAPGPGTEPDPKPTNPDKTKGTSKQ
ncbi:MAG: hypothetical protein CMJ85_14615 [Planctomycetes bacterium]|jgi:hypothetical protein|nr:hypothetical protein [Planctomycetota bacterium]MDP6424890.1 hypothetical protein [Planctomycetota bacterium]